MDATIKLCYQDKRILVAIKPCGILSTDEPGGMPELVRAVLGDPNACIRTVHRLDRVVSGLMVFARSAVASSNLSKQIREGIFQKKYLAVIHGIPTAPNGTLTDLLQRSRQERKTYVVKKTAKGVQEAVLDYRVLETVKDMSLLEIVLKTGRTHQIRAQFSARNLPLLGDRKYSTFDDPCNIALWSYSLGFYHPEDGNWMEFLETPPKIFPWTEFQFLFNGVENYQDEMLDVVDDFGVPTGEKIERRLAHSLGIQHRTAHVWIIRKRAGQLQVLLQKRSLIKDSYPGCYDISSAGHIPAGCEYIPSALRELKEELGYIAEPGQLIYCGQRRFEIKEIFHNKVFHDRQVSNVYLIWINQEERDFILQQEEVSSVQWFDFDNCIRQVSTNEIPHCIYLEELNMVKAKAEEIDKSV